MVRTNLLSPCCSSDLELESLACSRFRCVNCRRSWDNKELIAAVDLRAGHLRSFQTAGAEDFRADWLHRFARTLSQVHIGRSATK